MCLTKAKIQDDVDVILAGYENGNIILWDIQTSKIMDELNVHKEPGNTTREIKSMVFKKHASVNDSKKTCIINSLNLFHGDNGETMWC